MASPLEYGRPAASRSRFAGAVEGARRNPAMFVQAVGIVLLVVVAAAILLGSLSFLNVWLLVGLTLVLGGIVAVRSHRERQRAWWIDQGCCAVCGYDLRASADRVCPECGRDGALDEPTWRRLRREHEAKFGRPPEPAETFAASQLSEAEIRRLLARAEESIGDL